MASTSARRALDVTILSKVRDFSEDERIRVVMSLLQMGLTYADIFTLAPNLLPPLSPTGATADPTAR